ncbi:hypothetical protein LJ707_10700 [Mucilaginibacter sp. UR6-1]|uniref:hypothetical protein n=1 Tax=Mucilaginibacter sp. UR6-1 TaxID=1435643 RepID=UPI001E428C5E|nr:hypothetical protein [Mucilaginibacter sp. UR6-1]MCC8409402.1 hypothetical protein [Mucilaginibacter sp. UR6-1]
MYAILIFLHSAMRWLVLASLLYAIVNALRGLPGKRLFTTADDKLRHITATIAHVQLAIGFVLYFNSPFILYFRQHYHEAIKQLPYLFFGMIHIGMMTLAVIIITVGSSVAKRRQTDQQKFSTMALWFTIALIIILISIPWPFSPLAQRPLLRTF